MKILNVLIIGLAILTNTVSHAKVTPEDANRVVLLLDTLQKDKNNLICRYFDDRENCIDRDWEAWYGDVGHQALDILKRIGLSYCWFDITNACRNRLEKNVGNPEKYRTDAGTAHKAALKAMLMTYENLLPVCEAITAILDHYQIPKTEHFELIKKCHGTWTPPRPKGPIPQSPPKS